MQLEILKAEPIVPAPPLCEACAGAERAYCPHASLPPQTPTLKRCPRCEETFPLSEFGICRARKDGLNLYCKRCIRQKIAHSRQALREYKNARIKQGATVVAERSRVSIDAMSGFSPRRIARILRKLSPADRVREAIRCGAETQTQIAQVTRLPKDEVCDALANLLLWTREIRTEARHNPRRYFVNDSPAVPVHSFPEPKEPRSHGVSTIHFEGESQFARGARR